MTCRRLESAAGGVIAFLMGARLPIPAKRRSRCPGRRKHPSARFRPGKPGSIGFSLTDRGRKVKKNGSGSTIGRPRGSFPKAVGNCRPLRNRL